MASQTRENLDTFRELRAWMRDDLGELGADPVVVRNDRITVEDVGTTGADAVLISPGPGDPDAAGVIITPSQQLAEAVCAEIEKALYETDRELGGGLVKVAGLANGLGYFSNARQTQTGDQFTSVVAELVPSDTREVTNEEFLEAWESKLKFPDV